MAIWLDECLARCLVKDQDENHDEVVNEDEDEYQYDGGGGCR